MISKIGNYYLNQPTKEAQGLREFSGEEYRKHGGFQVEKILRDEKIYHGDRVNFCGITWDTEISVTEKRIYKILIEKATSKSELDKVFESVLTYLVKELGKYSEYDKVLGEAYSWFTTDGSIQLIQFSGFEQCHIGVVFTTSIAKLLREQKYSGVFGKYEKIYEENKKAGSTYAVGYMKIVISFWAEVIGFIIIWFNRRIGLLLLILGLIFFIWATLQKRHHSKILVAKFIHKR